MKVITLLLLLLLGGAYPQERCRCKKAKKTDTTCWGWVGNHPPEDGGVVKEIRGRLVDAAGEPVGDALVEVFDHAEVALDGDSYGSNKQRRVAACWTDAEGAFCFKGLRPGKYEIRGSCLSGFDAGRTVIAFEPKTRKATSKEILVALHISG